MTATLFADASTIAHLQHQPKPHPGQSAGAALPPSTRDTHVIDLENRLRERLGTKVQLRYRQAKARSISASSATTNWNASCKYSE